MICLINHVYIYTKMNTARPKSLPKFEIVFYRVLWSKLIHENVNVLLGCFLSAFTLFWFRQPITIWPAHDKCVIRGGRLNLADVYSLRVQFCVLLYCVKLLIYDQGGILAMGGPQEIKMAWNMLKRQWAFLNTLHTA